MKKTAVFLLSFIVVFALSASLANAWTYCFRDTNYGAEYQVDLESSVIRGQAVLEGGTNFPAPITGVIEANTVFFAIGYLNSAGLRFYEVDRFSLSGTTWAIRSGDSSYYDNLHNIQLVPCGSMSKELEGISGAPE